MIFWKKKEITENRPVLTDMFFRAKRKIVSVKTNYFLLKFDQEKVKNFIHKDIVFLKYFVPAVFVLCVIVFSFNLKAGVADFYPTNCLGSWENPKNAEGVPEVKNNSDRNNFLASNSSVLNNTNGQLFCGNFSGEIPKDVLPKKFILKFSISATNENVVSTNPSASIDNIISPTDEQNTPAVNTAPITNPEVNSNTDTTTSPPASVPASVDPNVEQNTTSNNQNTATDNSSSDSSTVAPALQEIPTPTPAPASDSNSDSPVSYIFKNFLAAFAGGAVPDSTPTDSSLVDQNTSTSNSNSNSASNSILENQNDYLEASYTLDGQEWKTLGKINADNISNPSFEIPITNLNWEEISKIQISLTPILSIDKQKTIYLDGMWIESQYDDAQTAKSLPKVSIIDDSSVGMVEGNADFSSGDDPVFNISDPNLSNYQLATLVASSDAKIVEDKDKVLNGIAGIKENSDNTVEIVQPPSASGGILEKVGNTIGNIFSSVGKDNNTVPDIVPNTKIAPPATPYNKDNTSNDNVTSFLFGHKALADSLSAVNITDVKVLDNYGKETDISTTIEDVEKNGVTTSQVKINKPTREFRPGKYTLKVTVTTDTAIIETNQDFTWGVLVVNTDKSIYKTGDNAYLQMGVLNEAGHTICAAKLGMEVTSPSGVITNFSTESADIAGGAIKIIKDSECGPDNVVLSGVPDYHTNFTIPNDPSTGSGQGGIYKIKLTAETDNGIKTINDKFKVDNTAPFSVRRVTASRIRPTANYPVNIYVTPKEDFEGTIVEIVPSNFNILPPAKSTKYTGIKTVGENKIIYWNVYLKKGQEKVLGYYYDAPNISPELFLLGPLQFYSDPNFDIDSWTSGSLPNFQELRKWQIASDAPCSAISSGDWSNGANWSGCSGPRGMPDSTDDIDIPSGITINLDTGTNPAVANSVFIEGTLDTTMGSSNIDLITNNMIIDGGNFNAPNSDIQFTGKSGILVDQRNGGTSNFGVSRVHINGNNVNNSISWGSQSGSGSLSWSSIASDSTGQYLAATTFSGSDYIYTSTDHGSTWTQQTNPGAGNWVSIASDSTGQYLAAIGNTGSLFNVYTSNDYGATWTNHGGNISYPTGIASSSNGAKLIYGDTNSSNIFTSVDYGNTWTTASIAGASSWGMNFVSSNDGTHLANWRGNYIWTSTDSGANWTQRTGAGSRNWTEMASSGDGSKLVAIDYGGYIYTSTDYGVAWSNNSGSSGVANWQTVASSSDGLTLVAAVSSGDIYVSNDGGVSWSSQSVGSASWQSIAMSDDGTMIAAVYNGGDIWTGVKDTPILSQGGVNFYELSIEGDGVKKLGETITLGADLSINSGSLDTSFKTSSFNITTKHINISAGTLTLNNSSVSLDGSSGTSFNKTGGDFDAGASTVHFQGTGNDGVWNTAGVGSSDWRGTASSAYGTNVAAVAYGGYIYTSSSGGDNGTWSVSNYTTANWTSITSDSTGQYLAATDLSGDIWTANSGSWVDHTATSGHVWTSITSDSTGQYLAATSYGGYIWTSSNYGVSWNQQTGSGSANWTYITSDGTGQYLSAVADNLTYVYTSSNYGVSWTTHSGSSGSHGWVSVAYSSDSTKLIAGTGADDLYVSSDKGATWSALGVGYSYWKSVSLSHNGMVMSSVQSGGYIYVSTDYGATWSAQTTPPSGSWSSVTVSADGSKIIGGTNGSDISVGAFGLFATKGSPLFDKISIDGGSGGISLSEDLNVIQSFDINSGSFVSGVYSINAGVINMAGGNFFPDNSNIYLSGIGSTATLYTFTGGTIHSNTATINLVGNEDDTIAGGSPPIYALNISGTGTKSMAEDLNLTGTLTISGGYLDTGNNVVNAGNVVMNSGTFFAGSSNILLSGYGIVFDYTGGTFTPGTSTIKLIDSSSNTKRFSGGGQTYGNIWLSGSGNCTYVIIGNNTFANFKDDNTTSGAAVNFTAGSTTTISSWTVSGTAGNLITVQSTSAGTAWNLSASSGLMSSDYVSLQDSHASGGALYYAGSHSTNVSGNTGWVFTAPPCVAIGGVWGSGYNWTGSCTGAGGIPGTGDNVLIPTGNTMGQNVNSAVLGSIVINGTLLNSSNYSLSGTTLTIGSTGTLSLNSGSVNLSGTTGTPIVVTAGGTFTAGSGTVTLTGNNPSGNTTIETSITYYNLTLNNASETFVPNGALNGSGAGTLTVTAGTLDTTGSNYAINFGKINVAGTFTANASAITLSATSGTLFTKSGTFNQGTSTVILSGNGSATINSASTTFYNLTSSGTLIKTLASAITLASGGTLSVTKGTFDPSSYLITGSGSNTLSVGAVGTIRVGASTFAGNYSSGFTTKTFTTGSIVDYYLNGTQTVDNTLSYSYLYISTGGTKTLGGATTVNDDLVFAGGTLELSSYNFTVNGATSLLSGTLDDNNATGTNIFVGNVAISSGGYWTNTNNPGYTFRGGFSVNSSHFSSGTGVYTFDTNAQTLTSTAYSFTITNLTNNVTTGNGLTIPNSFPTVSTLTQGTNAVLTFSGTMPSIPTLGASSANGNIVQYTGVNQTVIATSYNALTINSSGTASLSGTTIVSNTLTLTAGTLDTTSANNYQLNAGNILINGGTLTVNNSSVMLTGISGTLFTKSSGTFNAGGSTVFTTGASGTPTLASGSPSFYNFTTAGAGVITLGEALTVTNILRSASGTFTTSASNYTVNAGSILMNGASATFTLGSSTVNLSGTSGTLVTFTTGTLTGNTANFNVTSLSGTPTLASGMTSAGFYNLTINGAGTKNLGEALTVTSNLYTNAGTLNTANYAISAGTLNIGGGTITAGSSVITLTGYGTVVNYTSGTYTAGTSTIKFTDASSNGKTFAGGGQTYGTVWFTGAGTGAYTISGSNTFNTFKMDDNTVAHTVNFTAGTTTTVTTWTVSGVSAKLITLQSTSGGSYWTLSKASGTATSDYLSLKDSHAGGGAGWFAGVNSTNVSGNTGWVFTGPGCTAIYTGNWNTAANWSNCTGGGIPTTGDNVLINTGVTITQDVASATLGTITINGTLNTGASNYALTGSRLTIAAGGTLTANNSVITLSGTTGTLFTKNVTGTFTAGGSTVTLTGTSGTPTIASGTPSFYNLTVNGSGGTPTLGEALTVSNALTITAGILQLSSFNTTITGATSITGTLNDNNVTGTNIFVGAVTVNSGGTWTTTNNPAFTFRGGLTVNTASTFTSGTGVYTFDTNAQTIAGTQTYTITNLTNNITTGNGLTFSGAQPTVTTLTQGSNAMLTFTGTVPTITTLTATASGNTIQYTSTTGAQTIKGATAYVNLIINNPGQIATLGGAVNASGNLTITAGTLELSTYSLIIGGSASIYGTLDDNSLTGNNSFSGGVVLYSGSTWSNTNNPTYNFYQGFTINSGASFSSGTGTYYFQNGTAQTLSANQAASITSIRNYDTTGNGLIIPNSNITFGTITMDVNSFITFSGSVPTITSLITGTYVPNTVQYTGSNQTIKGSNYNNLIINGSGTESLGGGISPLGTLTITAGTLDTTSANNYVINAGNILINGGTLLGNNSIISLMGTTGTLFTKSSGVFTAGTSTVKPTATSGTPTLASGTPSFYNLTVNGSGGTPTLGEALTVTNTLTVTAGTLTTSGSYYQVNAGTITVNGGTFTPGNSTINLTGTTGTLYTYTSGTITANSAPVNITGTSGTANINSFSLTVYSLTLSGTGTYSVGNNPLTITTNLAVSSGTLELNSATLNVTGTTTLSGTGTIDDNSAVGVNTFTGLVTLNGGTWSNTGGPGYHFQGGLIVNTGVTFSSGTGAYNFDTNAQTVAGTATYTITTVQNNLTSSNGLTFTSAQPSVGTLTQANNAVLTFAGTIPTITTLNVSNSGNTVQYTNTSAGQNVRAINYQNLVINDSGQTASLVGSTTAFGTLTITSGTLDTVLGSNFALTAGNILINGGTLLAQNSTITVSGTSGTLFTKSSGTFTAGTSTVTLTGTSGTPTLASGTPSFYNLTVNGAGGTPTLGETLNVTAQLTITAGTLATANNTVNAANILMNGAGGTLTPGSSTINLSGTSGTLFAFTAGTLTANTDSVNIISSSGTPTISSNNPTFYNLTINGAGTKNLGEALNATGNLYVNAGTLNTANYAISAGTLNIGGGTLSAGTSTITLTGNGTVVNYTSGTYSGTSSTIKFADATNNNKTFAGGNQTYGNIWMTGAGSGKYIFTGSNTFANFKDDNTTSGASINFTAGTTTTVSTWTVSGTAGNLITMQSTSAGSAWNLSDSSGTNTSNYVSLKDSNATGGAVFKAYNSTNVSGNTGWTFLTPRYWVGGAGNWSDTAHWAATSGGTGGQSVPTSSNDVFLDATSGAVAVSVDASATMNDLNCTGFTGSLYGSVGARSMSIYGSLTVVSGMSITQNPGLWFAFEGNATGRTITTAGQTLSYFIFNLTGGDITLQDNATLNQYIKFGYSGTGLMSGGTVNFTGRTVNVTGNTFGGSTDNVSGGTFNITNATINDSAGNGFYIKSGITLISTGSTINLTNAGPFFGGGKTYNIVNLSVGGSITINDANTFATLSRTNSGTDTTEQLVLAANQTVTGTLTLNGGADNRYRLLVTSDVLGTPRTITNNGSNSAQRVDFRDITGAGSASWNLSSITGGSGNSLGNSGITFNTARSMYWKTGSSGTYYYSNYNNSNPWYSLTNGGGTHYSNLDSPLPQDNVYFDASSVTGATTIAGDQRRMSANLDFTGATNSMTFAPTVDRTIYGSFTESASVTYNSVSSYYLNLEGRGSHTITTNGVTFPDTPVFNAYNGTYTFQDNFTTLGILSVPAGAGTTLAGNTKNITAKTFAFGSGTVNMSSGIWKTTAIAAYTVWSNSGATINSQTSTLELSGDLATAVVRTFTPVSGTVFNNINISGKSTTLAEWDLIDNFTVNGTFTIAAPNRIRVTSGKTITLGSSGVLSWVGTAGNLINFAPVTGTTPWVISKPSGTPVTADYIDLSYSTATQTNMFYAGTHSNNTVGNTNWLFSGAPCMAVTTGNWNTGANWANCSGAGGVPGTGDNVVINSGVVITMDVASPALGTITISGTLDTGASNYALTGTTLTVASTGTLTANNSTITLAGTTGTLFTNSGGTFTAGGSTVALTGTSGTPTLASGTPSFYNLTVNGSSGAPTLGEALTVTNNLTVTAGTLSTNASYYTVNAGRIVVNGGTFTPGNSTLNLTATSGTFYTFSSGTITANSAPVNMTGAGIQTVNSGSITFYSLALSTTGTKTLSGTVNITTTLTVSSGTLKLSSADLTVGGATSITGTLDDNTATGTNIFIGGVTVNSGGTWSNTNDPAFTFRGGLTVNTGATFSSGSGVYTFNTASQTVAGTATYTITNMTVATGAGNGVIFSGAQPTVTNLTVNASGVLSFSGTMPTIGTLTATASGNYVQYIGGAQTIIPTNYVNLYITNSGVKTLGGATTATGTVFVLGSSTLDTSSSNNYTLTTGAISLSSGTFNANNSTINLSGTSGTLFTKTSSTFTAGGSTVVLTGTSGTPTVASGTPSFYNLTVNGASGNPTLVSEALTATNTLTITAGTLTTSNNTVNAGRILVNGGTFTPGSSTINLTGTSGTLYAISSGTISSNTTSINTTGTSGTPTLASGTPVFYNLTINGAGGQPTLGEALTATSNLYVNAGTLNTANYAISAGTLNLGGGTLSAGTSTITLTGNGTVVNYTSGTYSGTSSTIKFTDATNNNKTFAGGGQTYGNVWFTGAGSGKYIISGNNTFTNFKDDNITSGAVLIFTASSNTTVGTWTVSGTAGNLITIQSSASGTYWTLTAASGIISSDYVSLQDSHAVTGGSAIFKAYFSSNVSGNTGWNFLTRRYWVGGTGNWDASTTTNWALVSGGAGGQSVPTSTSEVYFDANSGSGTATISINNATANIINMTGSTVTLAITDTMNVTVSGNVTLASGKFTASGDSSTISMNGTGTLITAGNTVGALTFNGASQTFTLGDAVTQRWHSVTTLAGGTLVTGAFTHTIGRIDTSGVTARAINVSGSTLNFNTVNDFTLWNLTSGVTYTDNSSTVFNFKTQSTQVTFGGGGATYTGSVNFLGGGGYTQTLFLINGANTFNNLSFDGSSSTSNTMVMSLSANQTITGTLTLKGGADNRYRLLVTSNTLGTARTITNNGSISAQRVDFRDITGAGSASWNLSSITGGSGNSLGNSGITFGIGGVSTPRSMYWKTTTTGVKYWSNYNGINPWYSATNGGGTNWTDSPLPQDSAYFDNNSIGAASTTVTVDVPRVAANIDFSALTSGTKPTFDQTVNYTVYGSFILTPSLPITYSASLYGLNLEGRSSHTLSLQNINTSYGFTMNAYGGTYTLGSDFYNTGNNSFIYYGTLSASTYNFASYSFYVYNTCTLNMGSGTWKINGTDFSIANTVTLNAGTSTLTKLYAGYNFNITAGGKALNNVNVPVLTGGAVFSILDDVTVNGVFTIAAPNIVRVTGGKTITMGAASSIVWNGVSGSPININVVSGTTPWNITKSSGSVDVNFVTMDYSAASGGATFKAHGSTDGGHNTGWTFVTSRFWVGGTANWDASTTTNWSATSNGAGGASVPTTSTDVYFDQNSGTGTATITGAGVVAGSVTETNGTGTNNMVLAVGADFNVYGNVTLLSSKLSMVANSFNINGAGTLISAGNTFTNVQINSGAGVSVVLGDALTSSLVRVNTGTLVTGAFTHNWGYFYFVNSGTAKGIDMTNSTINLSSASAGVAWEISSTPSSVTVTSTGSTINCTGATQTFNGGGKTYGTVTFSGTGLATLAGANTFTNLTRTNNATDTTEQLVLGANQTVSGVLTLNGGGDNRYRLLVTSDTLGTARTITANGSISAQRVDFRDITGAGSASWVLSSITGGAGNSLGNSGITFNTVRSMYWKTGTSGTKYYSNYNGINPWFSLTNGGGTNYTDSPLPQDNVYFDANSVTGATTVTQDQTRIAANLDFTGATSSLMFTQVSAWTVYGNLTFVVAPTINYQNITFEGRGTHTITTAGKAFGPSLNSYGGTYTLVGDELTTNDPCAFYSGTFNANGYNLTCLRLYMNGTSTVNMGSGLWKATYIGASNTSWYSTAGNTINAQTSTLELTSDVSTAVVRSFSPADGTVFNNINISGKASGTGQFNLTNSFTVNGVFTVAAPNILKVAGGKTISMGASASLNWTGTLANTISWNVISGTTAWNITKSSGTVNVNYNTLAYSAASGGATFTDTGGTDGGNNSGWTFPPAAAVTFSMSNNIADLGPLTSSASRYASAGPGTTGSSTEVEAHNFSVTATSSGGYSVTIIGASLTNLNGGHVITAIGGSNTAPNPGNEQFGLRMTATGGSGAVSSPYAASGFAYAATGSTSSQVCSASIGDGATTTYSVRYVANVSPVTTAGVYNTGLMYLVTGNF